MCVCIFGGTIGCIIYKMFMRHDIIGRGRGRGRGAGAGRASAGNFLARGVVGGGGRRGGSLPARNSFRRVT